MQKGELLLKFRTTEKQTALNHENVVDVSKELVRQLICKVTVE